MLTVWQKLQSNAYWVAFEGSAIGAGFDFVDDFIKQGHKIDFSGNNLHQFISSMLIGGFTAVRLLYRTPPKTPAILTDKPDKG
jgi:hypothetical protein